MSAKSSSKTPKGKDAGSAWSKVPGSSIDNKIDVLKASFEENLNSRDKKFDQKLELLKSSFESNLTTQLKSRDEKLDISFNRLDERFDTNEKQFESILNAINGNKDKPTETDHVPPDIEKVQFAPSDDKPQDVDKDPDDDDNFPTDKDATNVNTRPNVDIRPATPESIFSQYESLTNLQMSEKYFLPTPGKPRRKSSIAAILENKPYLDRTPENGHPQFGYNNRLKASSLNLDHCFLLEDDPLALKLLYDQLGSAVTAASTTFHTMFPNFDLIDEKTHFFNDLMSDKRYEDTNARGMIAAIAQKMAIRFKAKDFTDKINAPEITQVVETNRLLDNGWIILQEFFEVLHPKCGALLDNFDPHYDLSVLKILPNETQSSFLLRCTNLLNKFSMIKGVTPMFRLMEKVISLLYQVPMLSTPLAQLMNALNHHKLTQGDDNNEFMFNLDDIKNRLKGHKIKLSFNLNPQDAPVEIAALCKDIDFDIDTLANISAFNGKRIRCEICFRFHSVKYCPVRGDKFTHPSVLKRAKQYNIKHNEFEPQFPPREPNPPPLQAPPTGTPTTSNLSSDKKKKPHFSSSHKATINSFLTDYLQESSTKDVTNRDLATINSLGSTYLESFDSSQHPIHTLASLEDMMKDSDIALSNMSASITAAIAPTTAPTSATIRSDQLLRPVPGTLPSSTTERDIINNDSAYAARIASLATSEELDRRDPYTYQMFSSTLNFVSSLHDDDDEDDEDLSVDDTNDDDVSSESVGSTPVVLNVLSNTEEMNILFNNQPQRSQLLTPDALIAVHARDENNDLIDDEYYLDPNVASNVAPHEDFYLDPFIASNVARLPSSSEQPASDDDSSAVLFSDDDSASPRFAKTDRSGETTASSLLSIKELLEKDNSFFSNDGDALVKVISSAMDFGAPSNLMTLYTSGHLSKSQLLNFLRLVSQRWYSPAPPNPGSSATFPIDLSQGTTSDEPIILDETLSDSSENNPTTVPVIAAATNHLRGDPPSSVRDRNVLAPAPPSSPSIEPFIPQFRDNIFDGSEMCNFSK